eukprot:3723365-Amphidinium_carterae.1
MATVLKSSKFGHTAAFDATSTVNVNSVAALRTIAAGEVTQYNGLVVSINVEGVQATASFAPARLSAGGSSKYRDTVAKGHARDDNPTSSVIGRAECCAKERRASDRDWPQMRALS